MMQRDPAAEKEEQDDDIISKVTRMNHKIDYRDKEEDTNLLRTRLIQVAMLLAHRPRTVYEIGGDIGYANCNSIRPYLYYLEKNGIIQKMFPNKDKRTYWKLTPYALQTVFKRSSYPDYNTVADITKIPECWYWEFDIIKRWITFKEPLSIWDRQVISFKAICFGRATKSFKSHPNEWTVETWISLSRSFVNAYRRDHKPRPNSNSIPTSKLEAEAAKEGEVKIPGHWLLAIKAFVRDALEIEPTRSQCMKAGLDMDTTNKGRWGSTKLTNEEIEKCITWIESNDGGIKIAKQVGIEPARLQAHFALSIESCARPSRVLSIETDKVEVISQNPNDGENKIFVSCVRQETKVANQPPYLSLVIHPKLARWVADWTVHRRMIGEGYKFLFIDSNSYQPKQGDSPLLKEIREKYIHIYKYMFVAIGKNPLKKSDAIFFDRTLYCFRHLAVKLWLSRGLSLDQISRMGWERTDTLASWYGVIEFDDIQSKLNLTILTSTTEPQKKAI